MILFVCMVQPLFHRKFALNYLDRLVNAILEYVSKMEELTIRNFSKERYENIYQAINEFLKRIKKSEERKKITEDFQLQLILRFLFSDFLDKKLHAVTIMTQFLKLCKHSMTLISAKDFEKWIRDNKILPVIYN